MRASSKPYIVCGGHRYIFNQIGMMAYCVGHKTLTYKSIGKRKKNQNKARTPCF